MATVGVGQLALVVAAFSRVIDPGWPAFGSMGSLAGAGMAVVGLVHLRFHQAAGKPWVRVLGLMAVLAGLGYTAAWLTLDGGVFRTNDAPRVVALTTADLAFAASCLLAAAATWRSRMVGLVGAPIILAIRGAIELRYLAGVLDPPPPNNPGTSSGLEGIFIGVLVVGGWVILALWQLAIAGWLLRLRR